MVIYSPVISGSLIISGSIVTTSGGLPLTGSLVSSGSFTSIGPTVISGSLTVITGSSVEFQVLDTGVRIGNLASDNHNITGSLRVSGSITGSGFLTTGTITAQTLVVQTVTSSTDFVTGSTRFGSLASNTHQFTGSVLMSGSLNVNSSSFYVGTNNQVGINTSSPESQFVVAAKTGNSASVEINLNNSGYGRIFAYNRAGVTAANLVLNDPGGNVGIGTTTPSAKLEVNVGLNSLKISGRDTYVDSTEDPTNANIYVTQAGVGDFSQLAGNLVLQARTQGTVYRDIIFAGGLSNGDALMTILGEGNVGIGTTSPSTILHLNSTTTQLTLQNTDGGANAERVGMFMTGGDTFKLISLNDNNTTRVDNILVTNVLTGNIGIGTSSPSYKLDIRNDIAASTSLEPISLGLYNGSDGGSAIYFRNSVNGQSKISFGVEAVGSGTDDTYLGFSTGGNASLSERMRITSGGNILVNAGYVYINGEGNGVAIDSGTASVARTGFMKYGGFEGMLISGNSTKVRLCHRTDSDYVIGGTPTIREDLVIQTNGTVTIAGALSKGSGTFRIDHPLESKKDTHHLVHSFIEGPRVDLIYRGKVTLVNGTATINIDETVGMTEGTFVALVRETQVFTTNESSWDAVKGKVEGNILTITSQNSESIDEISWMVIGERQDKHIKDTDWTDENGKPILEPLKINN